MFLLETKTGHLRRVDNPGQEHYAVLSHVWAKEGDPDFPEPSYQDICKLQEAANGRPILHKLSRKIANFCEVALKDGFELGWVDTCCIDKSSSAELSEAINSMYDWYRHSGVCYAFLRDVSSVEHFRNSKWFTRAWTLQELLAPRDLVFLSNAWKVVGSKHTLAPLIHLATGIERAVLTFDRPLEDVGIATRMSWAASRVATREEDRAYSLMGIFGIHMPLVYGEGGHGAFTRLQEEILKCNPDQTIFAWGPILPNRITLMFSEPRPSSPDSLSNLSSGHTPVSSQQGLLAFSPRDFKKRPPFTPISRETFAERVGISPEDSYQMSTPTPYGARIRLPLLIVQSQPDVPDLRLALLACEDYRGRMVALLLRPKEDASGQEYLVGSIFGEGEDRLAPAVPYTSPYSLTRLRNQYFRITLLSAEEIRACSKRGIVTMTDVYIPYRPSHLDNDLEQCVSIYRSLSEARHPFEVHVTPWSRNVLAAHGYRISKDSDATVPVTIYHRSFKFSAAIQICICHCELGRRFGLLAVRVSTGNLTCSVMDDFASEEHLASHPAHLSSWSCHGGVQPMLTKELELVSQEGKVLHLRLTMRYARQPKARQTSYLLGVEITGSIARPPINVAENQPVMTQNSPGSEVRSQSFKNAGSPTWRPRIRRMRSASSFRRAPLYMQTQATPLLQLSRELFHARNFPPMPDL